GRGGDGEAGERADHHHPLDPEVQDARTLGEDVAERGEQGRDGEPDAALPEAGSEDAGGEGAEGRHTARRLTIRPDIRSSTTPCITNTKSEETPSESCMNSLPFWSAAKRIAPATVGSSFASPRITSASAR